MSKHGSERRQIIGALGALAAGAWGAPVAAATTLNVEVQLLSTVFGAVGRAFFPWAFL